MNLFKKISLIAIIIGGIFFILISIIWMVYGIVTGNMEDVPKWMNIAMRINGGLILSGFVGMIFSFYRDIITAIKRTIKEY